MKPNIKQLTLTLLALVTTLASQAAIRLPHLICDKMIIQQQTDVRLWGWDKPGQTVTATTSWGVTTTAKTGKDGRWLLTVKSPKASYTPLTITFSDAGGSTTVKDILSGEVWVCAGQSNMEFPVRGFTNCPYEGYNETVASANQVKGIHYVKVPSTMRMTPQDDADCHWDAININTVTECSAVGYNFARIVNQATDIPVGLILANKGGTRVESWLDRDNLKKYTKDPLDSMAIVKKFPGDYHRSLMWGNGTFHPILNYTVKGILFYQGCSNVGDPGNQYSDRLKLLVEQWRRDFKLGDIPFYFVQVAPYCEGDGNDGISGALLREQQMRARDIIPNSDLVCTNDLVYPFEYTQIHPCQKRQVGERLGYIALKHDYDVQHIIAESPRYKSMFVENDTCFVSFDNMDGGYSRFEDIQGFEVAGDDHVFHPAKAQHFWVWTMGNDRRNETVAVFSPEVKHPVAVRYCFRNFQLGNLKNAGDLPLFPFRTDNW